MSSPASRLPRPVRRRRLLVLAVVGVAIGTVLPSPAHATPPRTTVAFPRALEAYSAYDGQRVCYGTAQPGVAAWRDLLMRTYSGSRNLGILRGCTVGGKSEHKEGRAFDWGVRVTTPAEKARAEELLRWLFATDSYGNQHAMARRLGLMYVIWNHRIWASYQAGSGWRAYTGANPHTDHIHFSFSWPGAKRVTSFWTGKPVAMPNPLPPVAASGSSSDLRGRRVSWLGPWVPEPSVPAGAVATGRPLVDETVVVGGNPGRAVSTGFLEAGERYQVEISGVFGWGGGLADAECSTTPGDAWRRNRSLVRRAEADHLDLYLNGVDILARPVTDTGNSCDAAQHRYAWTFTSERTLNAHLAIWDPTIAGNYGALRVRIRKDVPILDERIGVPANTVGGVLTRGSVRRGERYVMTAWGTWSYGDGQADAECSTSTLDGTWRRARSIDPERPDDDHLDLFVAEQDAGAAPVADVADDCDPVKHAYQWVWRADRDGPVPLSLWDLDHTDNTGGVTVRIRRADPLDQLEEMSLPAGEPAGVTAEHFLRSGQSYVLESAGTYEIDGGVVDAECSSLTVDPAFRRDRESEIVRDVLVNGRDLSWQPASGARGCDPGHVYRTTYRPGRDEPLTVRVPGGGGGQLLVRIVPAAQAGLLDRTDADPSPSPAE